MGVFVSSFADLPYTLAKSSQNQLAKLSLTTPLILSVVSSTETALSDPKSRPSLARPSTAELLMSVATNLVI